MLTNKKILVRVLAFVLVLVMASAMFVSCKDTTAADAKAEAEAAKQAAADAQKAAEDAAKLAQQLQEQLNAANDKIAELEKEPEAGEPPIIEDDYIGTTTKLVTDKVLAKFSALKAEYLTVRQNWYTSENYKKVAEIFEEAAFNLYRATTAEGVEAVINNAKTAADAIDNVVSDAAKVQALIAAFGDVDTAVTLASEGKIEDAIDALEDFAEKYAPVLLPTADPKNLDEDDIMNILAIADNLTKGEAYVNVEDKNGLIDAIDKLEMLMDASDDVSDAIADVVDAILDNTGSEWEQIKPEADDLEAVYELYKRFYTLNGGDDSSIKATLDDGSKLTGEEFIKEYVLVLFDRQFTAYQQIASDFLDAQLKFLLNPADESVSDIFGGFDYAESLMVFPTYSFSYDNGAELGAAVDVKVDTAKQTIEVYTADATLASISINAAEFQRDFKRIVSKEMVNINALDFEDDFKGVKTLADAYKTVDKFVVNGVIEMTNFYYTEVILPVIEEMVEEKKAYLDETLEALDKAPGTAAANVFYSDVFEALNDKLSASWDAVATKAADVQALTYEKLDARATDAKTYKISQTELFNLAAMKDADGILTGNIVLSEKNGKAATLTMIYDEVAKVVEDAFTAFYTADIAFVEEISFFNFKMDLAKELDDYADFNGVLNIDKDSSKLYVVETEIYVDTDAYIDYAFGGDGDDYDDAKGIDWYKEEGGNTYLTLIGAVSLAAGDDNIQRKDMYTKISNIAYAKRSEIMNLDLASYKSSTYAAKRASNGKTLCMAKDSNGEKFSTMINKGTNTTGGDKNPAINIEIDKLTAAKNAATELFATTADSMLVMLLDACRANVKAELAAATDLYKNNYFGDVDAVALQKDMDAYIAFLTELTDVAKNGSFKTFTATTGHLKEKFGSGKVGAELAGYFAEYLDSQSKWMFHINGLETNGVEGDVYGATYTTYGDYFSTAAEKTTDVVIENKVTAAKDAAESALVAYATGTEVSEYYLDGIVNDAEINVYLTLEKADALADLAEVKQLTYYKDNILTGKKEGTLEYLYYTFAGLEKTNADGSVTVEIAVQDAYKYEAGNARTALYLKRLAEVMARVEEKISAVTLISVVEDDLVKEGETPYEAAVRVIGEIMTQAENAVSETDEDLVALDDYSFAIAYRRYYLDAVNANGLTPYDWTFYAENIG